MPSPSREDPPSTENRLVWWLNLAKLVLTVILLALAVREGLGGVLPP